MKYKGKKALGNVSVPSITGALVGTAAMPQPVTELVPWLPSTWPPAPIKVTADFIETLESIFQESMLEEINNVINDAKGDLDRRGHVVAISLMCALDAISTYGYRGNHMSKFIKAHFPDDYIPHCDRFYTLYRNSLVHSWNLFEATLYPGDEPVKDVAGTLTFGLLNFKKALEHAVADFLKKLDANVQLQNNTLNRYGNLRKNARP
ncbi:MAG TPA: hypothetical protein VHA33_22535 [Candidatus Angelobacter sp.]|jgi:hypothetical protein|nr:hypothetical protein [Candidatus Angelobacter sp.]